MTCPTTSREGRVRLPDPAPDAEERTMPAYHRTIVPKPRGHSRRAGLFTVRYPRSLPEAELERLKLALDLIPMAGSVMIPKDYELEWVGPKVVNRRRSRVSEAKMLRAMRRRGRR